MGSISNGDLAFISERTFIDPKYSVAIDGEAVTDFDGLRFLKRNANAKFFDYFARQRIEWVFPILDFAAW